MGAWIETTIEGVNLLSLSTVAPRVGAWIETCTSLSSLAFSVSHPVWVRGLKHEFAYNTQYYTLSHPVWVRGLKRLNAGTLAMWFRRTPCGCVD